MRTLAILSFALVASLSAPIAAFAQQLPDGSYCEGSSVCASGYCQADATGTGTCQPSSSANPQPTANPANPQPTSNPGTALMNPLGEGTTVNSFLLSILNIITNTVGPVIVILMLVYVGFKFVTAQGEPGKITEARQMLLWTLVGALILLGAKAIAMGIQATVSALSTG